jgi:hypothetical protein
VRDVHVGGDGPLEAEVRPHHADHLERLAVDHHVGAEDGATAAEPPLPQLVPEHDQRRPAGPGLPRRERPPERRPGAEQAEEVGRGEEHAHLLRGGIARPGSRPGQRALPLVQARRALDHPAGRLERRDVGPARLPRLRSKTLP